MCSHTPSALNAGAKRSGATCHMAMPQCCYLAKGAKRPSHTTNMQTFPNKSSFYILAVTTLKGSNLNSAVWDRIFIFCCMNRPPFSTTAIKFENISHFFYGYDHVVFTHCFLKYSSNLITASQIGR